MADSHTAPQFDSAALITIDTQQDLLDGGTLPIAGTSAALPAMRRVTEAFREAGSPIVHVVRLYEQDGSNAEPCRREMLAGGARILIRDTPGCQLPADLLPDPELRLDTQHLLGG